MDAYFNLFDQLLDFVLLRRYNSFLDELPVVRSARLDNQVNVLNLYFHGLRKNPAPRNLDCDLFCISLNHLSRGAQQPAKEWSKRVFFELHVLLRYPSIPLVYLDVIRCKVLEQCEKIY